MIEKVQIELDRTMLRSRTLVNLKLFFKIDYLFRTTTLLKGSNNFFVFVKITFFFFLATSLNLSGQNYVKDLWNVSKLVPKNLLEFECVVRNWKNEPKVWIQSMNQK